MTNFDARARVGVVCASLWVLVGCTVEPHLIPTPALFKDQRLEFAPRLPPELRSTRLPVFYGTTRAPAPAGKPGHYINAAGEGMQLGVAEVRLGEPSWTWDDLVASAGTDTVERARPGAVSWAQSTRNSPGRETGRSCSTSTATA